MSSQPAGFTSRKRPFDEHYFSDEICHDSVSNRLASKGLRDFDCSLLTSFMVEKTIVESFKKSRHTLSSLRSVQIVVKVGPLDVFKVAAACRIVAVVREQIAVHNWQDLGDVPALQFRRLHVHQ